MNAFLRSMALVLCVWLSMAGACLGKQVYLRDGSIVDCQSFWRSGDQVFVKINRDTIVDFQDKEVNMKRTFHATGKKSHHVRQKISAVPVQATDANAPVVTAAAVPKPANQSVPAAAPAPVPATPHAQAPVPVTVQPVPAQPVPVPAQPETAQPVAADSSTPPGKEDLESRRKQAAEMMAEAIRNNDQELMKKAIELQQGVAPAQMNAQVNALKLAVAIFQKMMIVFLVINIFMIVCTWIVFEKAGEAGWKSLVPIYNCYVLMEVSGCPGWWVVLMLIPVVNLVFFLLAMLSLSGKFGKGALFGVGLWLLPVFFFPVLAFGGAQYER